MHSQDELACLAIENGADLNATDTTFRTPFYNAVLTGCWKAACMILTRSTEKSVEQLLKNELPNALRLKLTFFQEWSGYHDAQKKSADRFSLFGCCLSPSKPEGLIGDVQELIEEGQRMKKSDDETLNSILDCVMKYAKREGTKLSAAEEVICVLAQKRQKVDSAYDPVVPYSSSSLALT